MPTSTSLGCFGSALQQCTSNFFGCLFCSESVVCLWRCCPWALHLSQVCFPNCDSSLREQFTLQACPKRQNSYRKFTFFPPYWLMFCGALLPSKVSFLLFPGEMELQLNSWLLIFYIRELKCIIKNPFKDWQTSVTVKSFLCVCIQCSVEKRYFREVH